MPRSWKLVSSLCLDGEGEERDEGRIEMFRDVEERNRWVAKAVATAVPSSPAPRTRMEVCEAMFGGYGEERRKRTTMGMGVTHVHNM